MSRNPFIMSDDVETGLRIAVGQVRGLAMQASMSVKEASVSTPIAQKILGNSSVRQERVGSVDSGYRRSFTRLVPLFGGDHRKRGIACEFPRKRWFCVIWKDNWQGFQRWVSEKDAD